MGDESGVFQDCSKRCQKDWSWSGRFESVSKKNKRWGPETRQAMADAPATRARQEKATTDRANGSESGYNVLQSWWWQGQSSIDVTPLLGIAVLRG